MNEFASGTKKYGCFTVRNITSDRQKTIHIFNSPILFNTTRDLLQIPGVSESDIRVSLLKGELRHKIINKDIIIECSDIDLLQFNNDQKEFLQLAGVSNGLGFENTGNSDIVKTIAYEKATFNAIIQGIATGQNKSIFSMFNSSDKKIKIEEIYLINAKVTNVIGISGTFEIRRISGHSAGTLITSIETYETDDVLDSGVTLRTGAAVVGESVNLLWKSVFSTDEHGIIEENISNIEHIFQTMFPIFVKKTTNAKTITLKTNEGLTIKFLQNSTVGSFDIFCVFTQE